MQRVERIKLENQWENAKSQLALEKIHNRFRRSTEEDSLILHAIEKDEKVASFTIERLPDDVLNELADTRFTERSAGLAHYDVFFRYFNDVIFCRLF